MKKFVCLMLASVLLFAFSFQSFAATTNKNSDKAPLTGRQRNILKAYGLTEKEINDIDRETIQYVLRHGKVEDPLSYSKTPPVFGQNIFRTIEEAKLKAKGLTDIQIKGLRQRGYTYEEINEMDTATINSLVIITATAPAPDGFNYVSEIPDSGDGGDGEEWFHWDVDVTDNDLQWYVTASEDFAKYIFSEQSDSSLRWSYYLYGEWDDGSSVDPYGEKDGPGGTHEGVDTRHYTSGRTVKSATDGDVLNISTNYGGYIQIYDDYLKETITYMHVVVDPNLKIGDPIEPGDLIGTQSTSLNHVHFQAVDGKTTSIPPGKDDTSLDSRIPYGFMTWYLP